MIKTTNSETIKVIQITDCHLMADKESTLKQSNTFHSLQRICTQITNKHKDTDLLLLTGDLSQDGSMASYNLLNSLITQTKIPFITLPGNHDQLTNMQTAFSVNTISCDKQISLGQWQILLLNSTIDGAVNGRIDKKEMQWLKQQLANAPDTPTLIALHHPPIMVGSRWIDSIGLEEPDKLLDVVTNASNVRIVAFGHIHQVLFKQLQHVFFCSAPATCRQFKPSSDTFALDFLPPGYRVLELSTDGSFNTYVEFLTNSEPK